MGKKTKGGSSTETSNDKGKAKGAQKINVRHILCAKASKKDEALAKINAGSKFDEVAKEFSEDKARQGGALGWKLRGDLIKEFADVAFELDTSTVNSPKIGEAKTSEGYHLIMVEKRE